MTFTMPYAQLWNAGLSLNADGTITGTPYGTGAATLSFTVQVKDANSSVGYFECQINLRSAATLTLLPDTLTPGVVGHPYDTMMTIAGGTWPNTFTLQPGALPTGLTLGGQGRISGTPTAAGTFNFRIGLADSNNLTTHRDCALQVSQVVILLAPASLAASQQGVACSASVTASGGTAPYTFTLVSGSLPPGLALAPTGALTGTPQSGGTFNFRIQATDSKGFTGTCDYQITVGLPGLTITPDALPQTISGRSYSVVLAASGGTPACQFCVSSGTLPAGLTLSQNGNLSGTLQLAGTFQFQVQAQDPLGATGRRDYTLVVGAANIIVTPSVLEPATAGRAYSVTLVASGGRAPYRFSLDPTSALPLGMALASDGVLSGTPSNPGIYNFSFSVWDADQVRGALVMVLEVQQTGLLITPDLLPYATLGTPYTVTSAAQGGSAPYRFALDSGSLPRGLQLDPSGTLSGNLVEAGLFPFRIKATDKSGASGLRDYQLRVPPLATIPDPLSTTTVGVPWGVSFGGSGATPPYRYTLAAGALPPGITVIGQNGLSGTPTSAGTFHFTIQVTDVNGATGTADYPLTAYSAGLSLVTESVPDGVVGQPYVAEVQAAGGKEPYAYSVLRGTLPAGIKLDSGGVLSGTTRAAGCSGSQYRCRTRRARRPNATTSWKSPPNRLSPSSPLGWTKLKRAPPTRILWRPQVEHRLTRGRSREAAYRRGSSSLPA